MAKKASSSKRASSSKKSARKAGSKGSKGKSGRRRRGSAKRRKVSTKQKPTARAAAEAAAGAGTRSKSVPLLSRRRVQPRGAANASLVHQFSRIEARDQWNAARKDAAPLVKELKSLELLSGLDLSACSALAHMSMATRQKLVALCVYLTAPLWAWMLLVPCAFTLVARGYDRHLGTRVAQLRSWRMWAAYLSALIVLPLSTAAGLATVITLTHWDDVHLSMVEAFAPLVGYSLVFAIGAGVLFTKLAIVNEQSQLERLRLLLERVSRNEARRGSLSHRDVEAMLATFDFDQVDEHLASILSDSMPNVAGLSRDTTRSTFEEEEEEEEEEQESSSGSGMYMYEYAYESSSASGSEASSSASSGSGSYESVSMTAFTKPARPAPSFAAEQEDEAIVSRLLGLFALSASSWRRAVVYVGLSLAVSILQAILGPLYRAHDEGSSSNEAWTDTVVAADAAWHDTLLRVLALYAVFATTLAVTGLLFKALFELHLVQGHLRALHNASTRHTDLVSRGGRGGARRPFVLTLHNSYMLFLWSELRARIRTRMDRANREAGPVVAAALAGVVTLTLFVVVRIVTLPQDSTFFDVVGVYTLFNMLLLLVFLYAIVSAGITIASFRSKQQFFIASQKHRLRKTLHEAQPESEDAARVQDLINALDAQILEVADQPPPSILSIGLTPQLRTRILGVAATAVVGALVRFIEV